MPTTKPDDRRRPERVASRVKEEISLALRRDLEDPRLAGVVLSSVFVTDDLSIARISIVASGDDAQGTKAAAAVRVLQRLEGMLRKRIGTRLAMRRLPSLKFEVDRGREEASRLDQLLTEVEHELHTSGGGERKQ